MVASQAIRTVADIRISRTFGELRQWIAELPARDRAAVVWARPELDRALEQLLEKPLEHAVVREALRNFLHVVLGLRALPAIVERWPANDVWKTIEDRVQVVRDFLQDDLVVREFEVALRIIGAVMTAAAPQQEALADTLRNVDPEELADALSKDRCAPLLYAEVMLFAVLEAAERGGPRDRARDLTRAALIGAVESAAMLSRAGMAIDLIEVRALLGSDDELLLSMAKGQLLGGFDNIQHLRAAVCPEPLRPRTEDVAPEKPPRAVRIVGRVSSAFFHSYGSNVVLTIGDTTMVTEATPELAAQAIALRDALVEGWILDTGNVRKLLRIDALGAVRAEDAIITRDLLRDWDELLHRLAR